MFDIGLPEMMVIAVVALVVVGPKDLPRVIRAFANGLAKLRTMASEFKAGVNEFVRESELTELQDAVKKTKDAMDVPGQFADFVDPTGDIRDPLGTKKNSSTGGTARNKDKPTTGAQD